MQKNRKHFSKVKGSKVCKKKMYARMLEDVTREKILKGDLDREDCDKGNAHGFIYLLKRRVTAQEDDTKEDREE